ncbi:MAG: nucleotidyltransferase domain-containing protein, partial [candidate division KSB1 bacterium]|nr:nucleotidyltransferase domain-containing protein [candidate division KSB1 bacterium]
MLFGSYARDMATQDSDVELLVIVPEVKNKFREMIQL